MKRLGTASHPRSIFIAMVLFIVLSGCHPGSYVPAPRYGARMISDPIEKRVIMFGGRAEGTFGLKYYDDLWAFDYLTQNWTLLKTTRKPAARLSHGMVYPPPDHSIR